MNTIVLFGGRSDERHVSVASAQNVVRALGTPLCWFWAPGGAVHDVAVDDLLDHRRPFEVDFDPTRPALWPDLEQALDTVPVDDPVFLLAVHGTEGEDGTLQRMLEKRSLPFTGSNSAASAAAFDKGRAKDLLRGRVAMPESQIAKTWSELPTVVDEMLIRHQKLVLKPLAGGSSRGLFFIERGERFDGTVNVPYLVEQFVAGREVTVAVVDMGKGLVALPALEVEVDPGRPFDYDGKYLDQGTREICPANIPDDVCDESQQIALDAHHILGCTGYSRTDVVIANNGIYFLELNSLPGLTARSLFPQELRAAGIDFRDFLEAQIALAKRE